MSGCIWSRWAWRLSAPAALALVVCAAFWAPELQATGERRPKRKAPTSLPATSEDSLGSTSGRLAPAPTRIPPEPGAPKAAEPPSAPDEPEAPASPRRPPHKTKAYDMVKIGENVRIGPDEVVRGDVVLVGGTLRVEGEIVGDAVVVGGNIEAGPTARIGGQAIAVGGHVDAAPGSDVRGEVNSLSVLRAPFLKNFDWPRVHHVGSIIFHVVKIGTWILAAALLLLLVPKRMLRAKEYLAASFPKCFGIGFLALTGGSFALGIAIVLLSITLIGIPLALLVTLAMVVLVVGSIVVGALVIGDKVREALRIEARSPIAVACLGIATLAVPALLGDLLRLGSNLGPAGFMLHLIYWAMLLAALSAGLGALLLSKLGAQATPEPPVGFAPGVPPGFQPPYGNWPTGSSGPGYSPGPPVPPGAAGVPGADSPLGS